MPRAKGGPKTKRKHKKWLKMAKGNWGARGNIYSMAKETVIKGQTYAYRDRKNRKREFRRLWITRISAAVRQEGMSYSQFMGGLNKAGIVINRKMLSEMAIHEPEAFKKLVEEARAAIN